MQQIADWLKKLGMSEYAERFAENDIDMAVLPDLTDQHLKDLGVSLGHRLKMLRAIRDLSGASVIVAAPSAPVETQPTQRDEAERRQLTVMFTDLVGSTALSTKLDPEDLRSVISACHKCVAETVARLDGFVAKYMGDGVLAYFGYPQAHEHDAERAVRAGLNLVEAVPKLATNAGSPLQVRVGIATGLVVVGDLIGAGAAQEQAVVGETPNLAARLQALAEPGAVVISASTRQLTGGLFEYHALGSVGLKGFAESVPAWQVLGAGTAESRFEALRATTTPLVGRDEEIDLLVRRWEQAKRGDGCVVLISGEPGIGKSRIAQTVLERISAEPHIRLRYFCSPHHQDSALYPSIAQLERAAGFRRDDTDEQRLAKLEALLSQGTNDLSEPVPLLADLLSIPTGDRYPVLNLTPQKRKEKTLHAQLAQVEGLAAQQPVLMVCEDAHWSDPTTRESLDLLIDRVPTLRVLVIITFRPEFTPPWVGRPQVTLLSLSRLPPRQRAEMIVYVTGGKALPREIADQIVDRTDGVPLFIEELTKTVLESGILTEIDDRYTVAGPMAPLAIPTTLHSSLLARLDRLAPTREVAQIGAALGRSFSHELISAVAQMPQQKLDDALARLVDAELVFRRGVPPDAEYTFKHVLVQDAAYSTMLRSRRHQIHARITAALEGQFPEIVKTQPELLARHCVEAGLVEKAVDYWLRAGRQALRRSAMVEALGQLRRGFATLGAVAESPQRQHQELKLQIALGGALIATEGFAAKVTGEAYARAVHLCWQLGQLTHLAPALSGQWVHHLVRAELNRARQLSLRMLQLGEDRDDAILKFMGARYSGQTCLYLGEFSEAHTYSSKALGLYTPTYRRSLENAHVAILCDISRELLCLGYLDQARVQQDEALAEAHQLSHAYTLAYALCIGCVGDWGIVSDGLVLRRAEELVAIATEHHLADFWQVGKVSCGWCNASMGHQAHGTTLIHKSLDHYRRVGSRLFEPAIRILYAEAHSKAGQPPAALDQLAEAEKLVEATNERWIEAELHRVRGKLLMELGEFAGAEDSLRKAIVVARRQSAKTFELRAAICLARLWRDQGKRTEAHDLLAPIYGWFTEGFDTPVLRDANALLDQLT
jgi:class 3 adenylate cyclase/predicted ATPase